jgi:hypothetical protein
VRVGRDAVELGGAAARHAEAADDLVEDEQRAVRAREVAQMRRNSARWSSRPLLAGTGSMITAAILVALGGEERVAAASSSSGSTR